MNSLWLDAQHGVPTRVRVRFLYARRMSMTQY